MTTIAGDNNEISQVFPNFEDSVGGANHLCGPKTYTFVQSSTFLSIDLTNYKIILKSTSASDSVSN